MECASCERPIREKYYLFAIDRNWHDDCLRCICCSCRLAELSWSFYYRSSMTLCLRCYVRLYGAEGRCFACSDLIGIFDWVMHAREQIYHLKCFACQKCNGRFCIGERFCLYDGKIFCYEQCNS